MPEIEKQNEWRAILRKMGQSILDRCDRPDADAETLLDSAQATIDLAKTELQEADAEHVAGAAQN